MKRILNQLNLGRRKNYADIATALEYICYQMTASGIQHGYRWMHMKCLQDGINVRRETVRLIIAAIDPEGVALRQSNRLRRRNYVSKGPHYMWHIDGYDKLKPYGIAIHGCIDGYSRFVIWLEAHSTNNNPYITAGYYVKAVRGIEGCPRRVRCDYGTENGHIERIHRMFRGGDGRCFIYGPSTQNQRIESWWGILRKECGQYWMELFYGLKEEGEFTGNLLDKNLIRFCFMALIKASYLTYTFIYSTIRFCKDICLKLSNANDIYVWCNVIIGSELLGIPHMFMLCKWTHHNLCSVSNLTSICVELKSGYYHWPHSRQVTGARCTEVAADQSWAEYSSRSTTGAKQWSMRWFNAWLESDLLLKSNFNCTHK